MTSHGGKGAESHRADKSGKFQRVPLSCHGWRGVQDPIGLAIRAGNAEHFPELVCINPRKLCQERCCLANYLHPYQSRATENVHLLGSPAQAIMQIRLKDRLFRCSQNHGSFLDLKYQGVETLMVNPLGEARGTPY